MEIGRPVRIIQPVPLREPKVIPVPNWPRPKKQPSKPILVPNWPVKKPAEVQNER